MDLPTRFELNNSWWHQSKLSTKEYPIGICVKCKKSKEIVCKGKCRPCYDQSRKGEKHDS
jgi:hypothetical protein